MRAVVMNCSVEAHFVDNYHQSPLRLHLSYQAWSLNRRQFQLNNDLGRFGLAIYAFEFDLQYRFETLYAGTAEQFHLGGY